MKRFKKIMIGISSMSLATITSALGISYALNTKQHINSIKHSNVVIKTALGDNFIEDVRNYANEIGVSKTKEIIANNLASGFSSNELDEITKEKFKTKTNNLIFANKFKNDVLSELRVIKRNNDKQKNDIQNLIKESNENQFDNYFRKIYIPLNIPGIIDVKPINEKINIQLPELSKWLINPFGAFYYEYEQWKKGSIDFVRSLFKEDFNKQYNIDDLSYLNDDSAKKSIFRNFNQSNDNQTPYFEIYIVGNQKLVYYNSEVYRVSRDTDFNDVNSIIKNNVSNKEISKIIYSAFNGIEENIKKKYSVEDEMSKDILKQAPSHLFNYIQLQTGERTYKEDGVKYDEFNDFLTTKASKQKDNHIDYKISLKKLSVIEYIVNEKLKKINSILKQQKQAYEEELRRRQIEERRREEERRRQEEDDRILKHNSLLFSQITSELLSIRHDLKEEIKIKYKAAEDAKRIEDVKRYSKIIFAIIDFAAATIGIASIFFPPLGILATILGSISIIGFIFNLILDAASSNKMKEAFVELDIALKEARYFLNLEPEKSFDFTKHKNSLSLGYNIVTTSETIIDIIEKIKLYSNNKGWKEGLKKLVNKGVNDLKTMIPKLRPEVTKKHLKKFLSQAPINKLKIIGNKTVRSLGFLPGIMFSIYDMYDFAENDIVNIKNERKYLDQVGQLVKLLK